MRYLATCFLLLSSCYSPNAAAIGQSCNDSSSDPLGLATESHIFIDQSNCSCSNDYDIESARNPETPFCSLRGLASKTLYSGDNVLIRKGDYDISEGGTKDGFFIKGDLNSIEKDRVFIQAYPEEDVTIRAADVCIENCDNGNVDDDLFSNSYLIKITDLKNLTISGINFEGFITNPRDPNTVIRRANLIRIINGDGLAIENSKIQNHESTSSYDIAFNKRKGNYRGVDDEDNSKFVRGAQGLRVHKTDSFEIKSTTFDCLQFPHLVAPNNQTKGHDLDITTSTNGRISDSKFGSCGHSSLRITGESAEIIVEDNHFQNLVHSDVNAFHSHGIVFRNNLFLPGNKFPSEPSYAANNLNMTAISRTMIYNNIFEGGDYKSGGLVFGIFNGDFYDDPAYRADSIYVFNNTFFGKGGTPLSIVEKQGSHPKKSLEAKVRQVKIFNNIFYETKKRVSNMEGPRRARKNYLLNIVPFNYYQFKTLSNDKIRLVSVDARTLTEDFGRIGNEIFNNIFYREGQNACDEAIHWGQGGSTYFDESLLEFAARDFASENRCLQPTMKNPEESDFSPADLSSAQTGTGNCKQNYFPDEALVDLNGNPRSRTNCSIGALEP